MFTYMLALSMFSIPLPTIEEKPAYFHIKVESTTPVSIHLQDQEIKPNSTYRTEPLNEEICIELEIRYVDGDEVKTKIVCLDLKPGHKTTYTIRIDASVTVAWC